MARYFTITIDEAGFKRLSNMVRSYHKSAVHIVEHGPGCGGDVSTDEENEERVKIATAMKEAIEDAAEITEKQWNELNDDALARRYE